MIDFKAAYHFPVFLDTYGFLYNVYSQVVAEFNELELCPFEQAQICKILNDESNLPEKPMGLHRYENVCYDARHNAVMSGNRVLVDIRGWGWLSHSFKHEEVIKFQDQFGEYLVTIIKQIL